MTSPRSILSTIPSFALTAGAVLLGGVVALGSMAGCSSLSSERKPIPDSTLTRLLTDIHLTVAREKVDAPYPKGLRDSVLAHHGVHPSEFDATLEYYSRRPQELKILYQPVIDSLKALRYDRSETDSPTIPDSVSKSKQRPPTP